jgi:putative tricarboxylic transport membrane protein
LTRPAGPASGSPTPRPAAARLKQAAAHGVVLALAAALLADVLAAGHLRLWPDRGYGLLVVAFAAVTAGAAILRALTGRDPDRGERLFAGLDGPGRARMLVFVGVWAAYAVVFPRIGFMPATALALAASMVAAARTRPPVALAAGAVTAVAVWFLFQRVLFVSLPMGPIELWLTTMLARM